VDVMKRETETRLYVIIYHMNFSHIFSVRRSMDSPTVTSLSPKISAMVVSSGGTVSTIAFEHI
jgi:hypothetical protein